MSCCVAGINWCLNLMCRAFALDGQVSAEWSRCPGFMTRRARDSVAPLRRSSAGWMPARIGKLTPGVGRRHPVTICQASLMGGQCGMYEHCGTRQECSTPLLNGPEQVFFCSIVAPVSQLEPASRLKSATCDVTFLRSDLRHR